jgi:hypothetical protein
MPAYTYGLLPWLAPDSEAARLHFSHAWSGAARHAITVGFVSLMIVGVAARVVPTLNGVDARRLSALWLPFVLLNAGCALRVSTQVLTDFTPRAFPFAGVSGVLEVTGLALWGAHLWLVMAGRPRLRRPALPPLPPLVAGAPIEEGHRVGEVLDLYPSLANVFAAFGFRPLANPFLRRTLATRVRVGEACQYLGVDPNGLLAALNAARPEAPPGRYSLPAPADHCCPSCAGAGHPAARSPSHPPEPAV